MKEHKNSMKINDWEVEKTAISEIALGISIRPTSLNLAPTFHYSLLDLLNIILEIALQAECFMPLIVHLTDSKDFRDNLNALRRRQDYHRGKYFLLPATNEKNDSALKPLLESVAGDFSFDPPRPVDIGTFCEKFKAKHEDIIYIFNLSRKDLPYALPFEFDKLKTFWENRYEGKEPQEKDEIETDSPKNEQKKEFYATLNRLQTVNIENFKGIKRIEQLDLDADIILISGANGNGKSSFVEAINLALTGFHPDMTLNKDRIPEVPDHFFHYKAEEFKITLCGKEKDHKDSKKNIILTTSCNRNSDRILAGIQPNIEYKIQNRVIPVPQQLNFRLTSYLPDHVKLLFDENMANHREGDKDTDILTIRELFPGLAPEVEALDEVAKDLLKKVKDEQEAIRTKLSDLVTNAEKIHSEAGSFFSELARLLESLHKATGEYFINPVEWQGVSNTPDAVFDVLEQQKTKIYDSRKLSYWRSLPGKLSQYKEKLPTDKKLTKLEAEKAKYEATIRELEERITHSASAELLEIKEMFLRLANREYLQIVQSELRKEKLFDVKKEVDLVNPETASICAQSLSSREIEREKAMESELNTTREKLEKLENQLEEARKSNLISQAFNVAEKCLINKAALLDAMDTFSSDYNSKEELKKDHIQHQEKIDALEQLIAFIKSERKDPEKFRKAMQRSLRAVLKRFAMADGMEEITIDKNFKIRADGDDTEKQRSLNCFSSGQRAQLGMAWLVAGRELLHSPANKDKVNFPHRIMIMDDPSTTFDLTNLHSQAILWRQLAYNSDPAKRYQIFIVSHHEEFSAKLLDLLCPPGKTENKCSMKLIRFTDWQPQEGSFYKVFDVEPAPKDINTAWDLFQKGLNYLEKNYEQASDN